MPNQVSPMLRKQIKKRFTLSVYVKILVAVCCMLYVCQLHAQKSINSTVNDLLSKFSSFGKAGSASDTARARPPFEDNITIFYYLKHHASPFSLDSSIRWQNRNQIGKPFFVNLGNLGTASKALYFQDDLKSNFRTNIHSQQLNMWDVSNVRYYQTTRPYTKLGYVTGPNKEFHYFVRHSQNITPTWNMALNFRLTLGNGFYQNQTINNSNFYYTNNFVSKNERLRIRAAYIINDLFQQESGGVFFPSSTTKQIIESISNNRVYARKKDLPVGLGNEIKQQDDLSNRQVGRNIKMEQAYATLSYDFGSKKAFYYDTYRQLEPALKKEINAYLKIDSLSESLDSLLAMQGIDFDLLKIQNDSLVSDSILDKKKSIQFIPRVRFSYTYQMDIVKHYFENTLFDATNPFYKTYYQTATYNKSNKDTLSIADEFEIHNNQFGVSYFLRAGRTDQYIKLSPSYTTYSNPLGENRMQADISIGGELKLNLWKNKIRTHTIGKQTLAGHYSGDQYLATTVSAFVPTIKSDLSVSIKNVTRSAPYHFTENSNFYLSPITNPTWEKESILKISSAIKIRPIKMTLAMSSYTLTNFLYFDNHYTPKQHVASVNIFQIHAQNEFTFLKVLKYTSDLWLQWSSDEATVNIPNLVTLQRLFVQGIAFKKQHVAAGIELRYVPSFYPQTYSPLIAEWVYQNKSIVNNYPTINAFVHFRIRGFSFYLRAEQLNTLNIDYQDGAFSYPQRNNEIYIWPYPYPSFSIRIGFYWNLIN